MATRKVQLLLNQLIRDLKENNFAYQPKPEKEIDWSSYNAAKINEINFYLEFVREAVESAALGKQGGGMMGRPPHDALGLAKVLLMQTYFQVAERQASGLALLFREKLGLGKVPSPRTIGRAYKRGDVRRILGAVFEATKVPMEGKETSFSADATGLPLSIKQNYANDRENRGKHAGYDKMGVMVGNNCHIATAFAHAEGTAGDSPMLKPLLDETSKCFDMHEIQLDAGFLSRENCTLATKAGATPYIYPKQGITINAKGSFSWKKMLLALIKDPQGWMRLYHARSNSECYFSAHKRRFAQPLRKKGRALRGVEAFCRVIGLNICMLISAYFEGAAEVKEFNHSYL